MGTDSMIFVPASFDKYDTHARPVSSWVPTMRVPAVIEVSMGTHGFFNYFIFFKKNFLIYLFFGTNNNLFLINKTLQL